VKHSECLQLLSTWLDADVLTVTNLSTNARLWSRLCGERPSFYGLNMGLCLPFAVGLSLAFPRRRVVALDGDGSLMIDVSSLITAADVNPANLVVIVFDNGSYTRMGETATARRADLEKIAQGAGVPRTATLRTLEEFEQAVRPALEGDEFCLFVAKVELERGSPSTFEQRTERAMKEVFQEAVRRLPDYAGED
jgi:thiamine pyrophosphate-dependent acetolactate synthase large subunit-like protein